jgi:arabinan endo-1,5-alpha-L-arabinosidase
VRDWCIHRAGVCAIVFLSAVLTACGGIGRNLDGAKQFDIPPEEIGGYQNPLPIAIPGGGAVTSCADPSIIRGQTPGDSYWYLYCTSDPLNDYDTDQSGHYRTHLISIQKSADLMNWKYAGDAFAIRPSWLDSSAGMWAPDIKFFNGKYYLYYAASATRAGGPAIGVATSSTPIGPWADKGSPVVEPQNIACGHRWVIDPEVVLGTRNYIFYGSFCGGVSVRSLSADGLTSDPMSEYPIAVDRRFEAATVVQHGGYYYLFLSTSTCCNGALSGYNVMVARSPQVIGPYVDQQGNSLLVPRAGGTPVISANGNRWVGPGHNAVFTDFAGQDYFLYHGIDRGHPYFAGAPGFTKRPVMLDPLDWKDGWPMVRGGFGPSDEKMPAPAAQPGVTNSYVAQFRTDDQLGSILANYSDDFTAPNLSMQWTWMDSRFLHSFTLTGSGFEFLSESGDLYVNRNDVSFLAEAAPTFDYVVETRLGFNVPEAGCCFNYAQAGLVIYRDDDNYIKLAHVSIDDTRQIEFAKEMAPVPAGYARYGSGFLGAPSDVIFLRIVCRHLKGSEQYTAYSSSDGTTWIRGGTWTHSIGGNARIGLVSMNFPGFKADFDYVHVYELVH